MTTITARTANAVVLAVLAGGLAALVLYPEPVVAAALVAVVAVLTVAIKLLHDAGHVD